MLHLYAFNPAAISRVPRAPLPSPPGLALQLDLHDSPISAHRLIQALFDGRRHIHNRIALLIGRRSHPQSDDDIGSNAIESGGRAHEHHEIQDHNRHDDQHGGNNGKFDHGLRRMALIPTAVTRLK